MSFKKVPEDVKKKISKTIKKLWKNDPQYKKRYINSLNKVKPNKPEQIILKIITNNCLNFIYVGNGTKWITAKNNKRFNPDFIDFINRKIIEFDGKYWHSNKKERDKLRNETYISKGYKLLVINEDDLDNLKKLNDKIINF